MEITAHSPKYNADGSIDLIVKFPWLAMEVSFCASQGDVEEYGRNIYIKASLGHYGEVIPYNTPMQPVPSSIEALQGLLAIDSYNLSTEYEEWANSPLRTFAQKTFINKAQTWKRNDPTLIEAAAALNITSVQLDQMFIAAAQL